MLLLAGSARVQHQSNNVNTAFRIRVDDATASPATAALTNTGHSRKPEGLEATSAIAAAAKDRGLAPCV